MGSVEQNINRILQRFPGVKKSVKRADQLAMYVVSPKLKSEGDIHRIIPMDEYE